MTAQIITFPDHLPPPPPLDPVGCALFLDLDGVLAPIVERPRDVGPDVRRNLVLRRLVERLDRRVAIVSGRTLAEVSAITEDAVPAVAGVHGLQRRTVLGDEMAACPTRIWPMPPPSSRPWPEPSPCCSSRRRA